MNLRKRGCQPQNIRERDSGQIEWMLGIYFLIILEILLCAKLQIASWNATSLYLEDALAASNLASALIDVREYGRTHRLVIADPAAAYAVYCDAVKENLQLDAAWECANKGIISGPVEIRDYIVYNVYGNTVTADRVGSGGMVSDTWSGVRGTMKAPNGKVIECTGVYSEIAFPVKSFLGLTMQAHKGNLADICAEN